MNEAKLRELKHRWREGVRLYKMGIHPNQDIIRKAVESLRGK